MLLIKCHILYTFHLCILVIFFYVSCLHNLRSGYGNELYVTEGTITVRDSDLYLYVPEDTITVRESDLYLYGPNGAAIVIQTGSMSSTQMRP